MVEIRLIWRPTVNWVFGENWIAHPHISFRNSLNSANIFSYLPCAICAVWGNTDISFVIKNAWASLWSGSHSASPVDRATQVREKHGLKVQTKWHDDVWNQFPLEAGLHMVVDIPFHMPNCAQGRASNINASVLQISWTGIWIRRAVQKVKDCTIIIAIWVP